MANELKKRLLLAKQRASVDIMRRMEVRLAEIKAAHATAIEELEHNHGNEIGARDEASEEHESRIEHMESALIDVKYWLHDGLVLNKLVSNPRDILRKVEEAIG